MTLPRSPDPIARLIRERRSALGLSLRALATAATARMPRRGSGRRGVSVSTAYLSLIENGRKVPDEAIALAIAAAIGADATVFRAWVAARKHADLDVALEAAETLRAFRGTSAGGPTPHADAALYAPRAPHPAEPDAPDTIRARLRVPAIAAGDDPGDGVRPSCPILGWHSLATETLSPDARRRLDRPFAIVLDDEAAAFGLPRGDRVLILRKCSGLAPETVCAVRAGGRVSLRRVTWDGRRALVLPRPGEHSFEIWEAPDEAALAARVIGAARRIRFDD